ncbi:hypothetical protein PGIGA_G00105200 [Pangasianodon gigas]|uniref:Uncharacterized protein n=1 Tax=Pangasianodon gigas TaxID=30993 RepID=A0ACC5W7R6_PANGG|nr:hypothetical protein [Pangasianodon gigas]
MERPKCGERKDLLMIHNIQAHQSSVVERSRSAARRELGTVGAQPETRLGLRTRSKEIQFEDMAFSSSMNDLLLTQPFRKKSDSKRQLPG